MDILETLKKSGLSDLIKIDKDKKKDKTVTVGETKWLVEEINYSKN